MWLSKCGLTTKVWDGYQSVGWLSKSGGWLQKCGVAIKVWGVHPSVVIGSVVNSVGVCGVPPENVGVSVGELNQNMIMFKKYFSKCLLMIFTEL